MHEQDRTETSELTDSELDTVQGGATLTRASDEDAPKTITARLQEAWKQMSRSAIP